MPMRFSTIFNCKEKKIAFFLLCSRIDCLATDDSNDGKIVFGFLQTMRKLTMKLCFHVFTPFERKTERRIRRWVESIGMWNKLQNTHSLRFGSKYYLRLDDFWSIDRLYGIFEFVARSSCVHDLLLLTFVASLSAATALSIYSITLHL